MEKSSGLHLAVKVVNTARKEDRRAVEREVEIMRRLQHPRLIQLYDAINTGKQIYVILELIEGGELFERVIDDDFVLTERSCAVFMRQICEGMEFIHSQNILHLDMKPENILCLTKEGNRIKIIDFGLARQYDPEKKLQVLFGTPEFVAPEVVNFDQIGFGTDMWSIGVICYVLLSGLSPFMGDNDMQTMANVTIAKYDFDDEAFADISQDAKDFIRSLLIKDKELRASASQCRAHPWLAKRSTVPSTRVGEKAEVEKPRTDVDVIVTREELDVTKDNLRLFVERWREHPNSPYLIEHHEANGSWHPDNARRSNSDENNVESVSLRGQSPSPCGSVSSSLSESTSSPRENGNFLLPVPNFSYAFERRASEGTALAPEKRDAAAQIVLAEEIIKLSEHLRSIAMGPKVSGTDNDAPNVDLPAESASSEEAKAFVSVNSTGVQDKAVKTSKPKEDEKSGLSRNGATTKISSKRSDSIVFTDTTTRTNEISEKLSNITKQRKINGTTFNGVRTFERNTESIPTPFATLKKTSKLQMDGAVPKENSSTNYDRLFRDRVKTSTFLQKSHTFGSTSKMEDMQIPFLNVEREMDLTPPWRRARSKHRFSETCRDVPRISNLQDIHKNLNLDEPTSTKDLLLQLLGEWDDASRPSGIGRKSVSVDWCGEESIARKSMNSLAEYFQSESQKTNAVGGGRPSTPPFIHR
ncbi:CBL-interacting serine/threonine-protein kinase 23 isoform X2 [Cephus cinctus]|nr:CBL-interacting serine/threonine-protein kinase 23 isoform X2 [Cephus cinctus]XP_024946837.1 CBL-interacting serine/threonine-protein kinase 23 isoform X2 [Cephus cinctus]XP_024946838.1 CBL-interacting serine/threonine-protein kinase 23 isoform X2 [Cephus cinctus]